MKKNGINVPKVIILMSTYNGEKYLAEQIESILNQTEKDFILKIHDDGSTDSTVSIIKKYANKDNRILIDQTGHKGYPKCFFDLMSDAGKADYYAFSDQDDVWLPEKIERAIHLIKNESGPALYGARKKIVDEALKEIRADVEQKPGIVYAFLCNNELSGCTMLFNRKLHNLLLSYIPQRADFYHDSWVYKVAILLGKVVIDKSAYILYRQHYDNTCGASKIGIEAFLFKVRNAIDIIKGYKSRPYSNGYVKEILVGYGDMLDCKAKSTLELIYNANRNMSCRLKLFTSSELSPLPVYSKIVKKSCILLGWI